MRSTLAVYHPDKPSVICILSTNYSGSHYLSLLLGSHSKAEHLGELRAFSKSSTTCTNPGCRHGECELIGKLEADAGQDIYGQVFHRTAPGISHLIDASKKPRWFKPLAADDRYNVFLIHLLRDPRAICRRWLHRFEQPAQQNRARIRLSRKLPHRCLKILTTDPTTLCIEKWIAENRAIDRFIQRSARPALRVTYRELAADTKATLATVCKFSHLNFEQSQIKYWRFNHHGTWKPEYEWVKQQGDCGFHDQRWKHFLSAEQMDQFQQHAGLSQYLHSLDYSLTDEGLV